MAGEKILISGRQLTGPVSFIAHRLLGKGYWVELWVTGGMHVEPCAHTEALREELAQAGAHVFVEPVTTGKQEAELRNNESTRLRYAPDVYIDTLLMTQTCNSGSSERPTDSFRDLEEKAGQILKEVVRSMHRKGQGRIIFFLTGKPYADFAPETACRMDWLRRMPDTASAITMYRAAAWMPFGIVVNAIWLESDGRQAQCEWYDFRGSTLSSEVETACHACELAAHLATMPVNIFSGSVFRFPVGSGKV